MSNKILVIGPSHILRIQHQVLYSILPSFPENVTFFGDGGMPVWHPMIEEHLSKNKYDKILVIVGDFRLGNQIFKGYTTDKLFGIDKDMINDKNDKVLLEKSLLALNNLVNNYKGVKLLFWALILREFKNKMNKKYYNNVGIYSHPTWSYYEIKKEFSTSLINIEFIFNQKKDFFTIDSSNHPSIYGYLVFYKAIQMIIQDKLDESMENFFYNAKEVMQRKIGSLPLVKSILVCDNKIMRYLNRDIGNEILPKIDTMSIISIENIHEREESLLLETPKSIIYIASYTFQRGNALREYKKLFEDIDFIKEKVGQCYVLLFSYNGKNILELRKKVKKHRYCIPNVKNPYELKVLEKMIPNPINILDMGLQFSNSLFEFRAEVFSFKGYLYLFYISFVGNHENIQKDFDLFYNFFINDFFNEIGLKSFNLPLR